MRITRISTPVSTVGRAAHNVDWPGRGFAPLAAPRVRATNKKSPEDVFDEMKRNFSDKKAKGVSMRWQWKLSGKDGGTWFVKIENGVLSMGKGTVADPHVTFICSADTWVQLSNGTLGGMRAFITGKLKLEGSKGDAKKLDELFPA